MSEFTEETDEQREARRARLRAQVAAMIAARVPQFDDRDREILAERQAAFLARQPGEGPREGDVVVFPGQMVRRVTYVWGIGDTPAGHLIQTGPMHGFYLGKSGYMSYSGSLYQSVPQGTMTDTGQTARVSAWFFHHDWHQANNSVDVWVDVKVWDCTAQAPGW